MVKMTYDRKFNFGKYKGFSFNEILEKDFQYLEYMNSKIKWLFNVSEKIKIRNTSNRLSNRDIITINGKCRSDFEEEMYNIFNKM